jgi:hypothetical protein
MNLLREMKAAEALGKLGEWCAARGLSEKWAAMVMMANGYGLVR